MQVESASDIQMNYMRLLVAQLQNQNPLEPLDNNEMASQLAQFSQLQQLESLNRSFQEVLTNTQLSYASSLIGKQVAFFNPADGTPMAGIVEQIAIDDEQVLLKVGEYLIGLRDIQAVGNSIGV